MKNTISIFEYFNRSLQSVRWVTSIILALIISSIVAFQTIQQRVETNKNILSAFSPYLKTLVSINDRTEILRVLNSISSSQGANLLIVKDQMVLASTGSISDIDRPFKNPSIIFSFLDIGFSQNEIITTKLIDKSSVILFFTPTKPILEKVITSIVISFLICIALSWLGARNLRRILRKTLTPLKQLHSEVKNLNFTKEAETTPIAIKELEEIRQEIIKTRIQLKDTNEKYVQEQAKQLNAESYKQLIHDLHNPVAALRQMVQILKSKYADEESKNEALESAPKIAEEILLQISSAKKNLEIDSLKFEVKDIRECIKESFVQIKALRKDQKQLLLNLPDEPVIVNHDSTTLKRAIINLLENGLEASRERVELSLEVKDGLTSIQVSDDGPGMDEEQIPIFFQGRGISSKANRQAFGLSSTNHIVRGHGGKVIYRTSSLGGAGIEIRLGSV